MSQDFAIPGLMPLSSPVFDSQGVVVPLTPYSLSDSLWPGISSIGPFTVNEVPPPFAVDYAVFTLSVGKRLPPDKIIGSRETDDGVLDILDAETWWFAIPEQALLIYPGNWSWKFTVFDTRGEALTIYRGTLLVTP